MEKEKIGTNAGKVWHALNQVKQISVAELSRKLDLSFEDIAVSVGWLARENKIFIQKQGSQLIISNKVGFDFFFG